MAIGDPVVRTRSDEEWENLILAVLQSSRSDYEDVDTSDFLVGGITLGQRRAELLHQDHQIQVDVPFSLSIFCRWPFKPDPLEENVRFLQELRQVVFKGVALDSDTRNHLIEITPIGLLTASWDELFEVLIEQDVSQYFDFD